MNTIGQDYEDKWGVYDLTGECVFECGTHLNHAADICHYLSGGSGVDRAYVHELMNTYAMKSGTRI